MELDLTNALKIHTNYNFKKYRGQELIQEINTHNLITDLMFNSMIKDISIYFQTFRNLLLGNGTTEPTATDTTLTSLLWQKYWEPIDSQIDNDATSISLTQTYEIPADTKYVGEITECGLGYAYGSEYIKTHALLRDTEGNPISINKTDLDRLLITVQLVFKFTVPEGVFLVNLRYSPLYYCLETNFVTVKPLSSYKAHDSDKALVIQHAYLSQDYQEVLDNGVRGYCHGDYGCLYSAGCNNGALATEEPPQATIPAERTKNFKGRIGDTYIVGEYVAYVKAIIFLGLFVIPLPNEKYFPEYTMSDINVGIGDGITTEFINPLNYFKKDTDKIYKNGILLTRDVDYTITHNNNRQGLVELFASTDARISGGLQDTTGRYSPLFRPQPFTLGYPYSNNYVWKMPPVIYAFDTENPLFLDMQQPVDVNYFRIGKGHRNNAKYSLYYKENEESEYVLLTSFIKTSDLFEQYFNKVVAQYFKVTIEAASGTNNVDSYALQGTVSSAGSNGTYSSTYCFPKDYSSLSNPNNFCVLGYRDEGKIIFTTPPAQDDIITMEVTMDLPMKNKNNVIDYDFTLTF